MPSKNKSGGCATCCDPCCATTHKLLAQVVVPGLPTLSNVEINPIGTCYAATDGVYDDVEQTDDGFEHPPSTVKGAPNWALNAIMEGEFHRQDYSNLDRIYDLDAYNFTEQCWRFALGNPSDNVLICQIVPISGTFDLVVGTEPDITPYWVHLSYYLYVDGNGDCILRIGAKLINNDRRTLVDKPFSPASGAQYLGEQVLSSISEWPHTDVPYQYSDFNPCAEDLGLLPLPTTGNYTMFPPGGGVWQSGVKTTLSDRRLWNSTLPFGGSTSGDLWIIDDVAPLPGNGNRDETLGWVWEINLSDATITDLAALPTTVLDWSTVIGTFTGDIRDGYTPVGSLPPGYFDGSWTYYQTGTVTLDSSSYIGGTPSSLDATYNYLVLNDGIGGHICGTTRPPFAEVECATGIEWQYRFLQQDLLYWHLQWGVDDGGVNINIPFKNLSITLSPAP